MDKKKKKRNWHGVVCQVTKMEKGKNKEGRESIEITAMTPKNEAITILGWDERCVRIKRSISEKDIGIFFGIFVRHKRPGLEGRYLLPFKFIPIEVKKKLRKDKDGKYLDIFLGSVNRLHLNGVQKEEGEESGV